MMALKNTNFYTLFEFKTKQKGEEGILSDFLIRS